MVVELEHVLGVGFDHIGGFLLDGIEEELGREYGFDGIDLVGLFVFALLDFSELSGADPFLGGVLVCLEPRGPERAGHHRFRCWQQYSYKLELTGC